jgi:hypothetical protein
MIRNKMSTTDGCHDAPNGPASREKARLLSFGLPFQPSPRHERLCRTDSGVATTPRVTVPRRPLL